MALLLQVHRLGTSSLALCLPNLPQIPVIGLECDWERIAWNRLLYDAPADSACTNHAMMVPSGQLAQGLGLISKLLAVPVPPEGILSPASQEDPAPSGPLQSFQSTSLDPISLLVAQRLH